MSLIQGEQNPVMGKDPQTNQIDLSTSPSNSPSCEQQTSDKLRHALIVSVLLSSFSLLSFLCFTRNNNFPVEYHPDEQTKVDQISGAEQRRNFNHPLIMLEIANCVRQAFHVVNDSRAIDIEGRTVSAAFAVISVISLALTGFILFGYPGLILCGLTIAICPPLFIYAHYFKEDTALVSGVSITLLGACLTLSSRSKRAQFFGTFVLAVGFSAATSAKYVGLVLVIPCLVALCISRPFNTWLTVLRLAVFLIVSGILILVINFRAFHSILPLRMEPQAYQQMVTEFGHGTTSQNEVALSKPNMFCLGIAFSELMPHIWIFLAVGLLYCIAKGYFTRQGFLIGLFAFTLAAALSFDAIPFERHALPLSVMGYFGGALLGAFLVVEMRNRPWFSSLALSVFLGCVLFLQGLRCINFNEQFRFDSRQRLREWIAANIPEGSVIVADRYAVLDGPGDPWRFPNQATKLPARIVSSARFSSDADPASRLAGTGAEYIVIAATTYQRYFVPTAHGVVTQELVFDRRHKFYSDLLTQGDLIWSSAGALPTHSYVNPELRLYRVSREADNIGKASGRGK